MEYNFDTTPVKTPVWKLGIPAMLAQLFNILYSIVDRVYIGHMADGAEIALASIGICSPAFTAIIDSFRYVLLYTGLYLCVLTLAIVAVPEVFVRLFLNDPAAIAQTAVFVRRYCIGFAFVAIQFAFVDGFTVMGMVKEAIPISFFRKILYVIATLLLPKFLPLEYIFYACPMSDCVGSIFTLAIYFFVLKKRLAIVMKQHGEC